MKFDIVTVYTMDNERIKGGLMSFNEGGIAIKYENNINYDKVIIPTHNIKMVCYDLKPTPIDEDN